MIDETYETIDGKWWLFKSDKKVRPLTDQEAVQVIWAKEQKEMNASEALYLFVGWLTSRSERVIMSATDEAVVAANLVSEFCDKHNLAPPNSERIRQENR